jgi:hypothetical protein
MWFATERAAVLVDGGQVTFNWVAEDRQTIPYQMIGTELFDDARVVLLDDWLRITCNDAPLFHVGWLATARVVPDSIWIGLPLWPLFVPLLIMLAWRTISERQRAQRRAAGRCVQCGYDLRESPVRCPECGHAVEGTTMRL